MSKNSVIFNCTNCDAQALKWSGRCVECGKWATMEESVGTTKKSAKKPGPARKTVGFNEVEEKDVERFQTKISEIDRVLGGGIVPGSLVLLGGEPGIGKSTIILQIASALSPKEVLYISGEESAEQIKMRVDRLRIKVENMQFLGETDIDAVCATIGKQKPSLAIVDSVQTMYTPEVASGAGSVNQVRAATVKLLEQAKQHHIPIIVIGHVTKEGMVAGPKTLEHLVDTVLYLEGDRKHHFRLLRTVKNRFGSTNEVGVFEMTEKGLEQVLNPSASFLETQDQRSSGSAITVIMEGSRPFLVEIQALVSKTVFGYPQRRASGFDLNRLQLLLAVLTQRAKLSLGNKDVYLNVVGGLKITEPAADLSVALAIASALNNKPLDPQLAAIGEIGLGGEIRSVSFMDKRIAEAIKLGYKKLIVPASIKTKEKVIKVKNVAEALKNI